MSILGSTWRAKCDASRKVNNALRREIVVQRQEINSLTMDVHRVILLSNVPWASDEARGRAFAEGVWASKLAGPSGVRGRFTVQDVLDAVAPPTEVGDE